MSRLLLKTVIKKFRIPIDEITKKILLLIKGITMFNYPSVYFEI